MLAALFHFIRDLAFLAAATGLAWWCWEELRARAQRQDDAARVSLAAERQAADLKAWTERIDARLDGLTARLEEIAASTRESEARAAQKVRVHKLLQSTADPFLTFHEIERALAQIGRLAEVATGGDGPARLSGDDLRRVLIELVRDGAVAQLDRDRYFIASDYEAGNEDEPDDAG